MAHDECIFVYFEMRKVWSWHHLFKWFSLSTTTTKVSPFLNHEIGTIILNRCSNSMLEATTKRGIIKCPKIQRMAVHLKIFLGFRRRLGSYFCSAFFIQDLFCYLICSMATTDCLVPEMLGHASIKYANKLPENMLSAKKVYENKGPQNSVVVCPWAANEKSGCK